MSTVKKGVLTIDGEWMKHLRKVGKRFFWKGERKAEKKLIRKEIEQNR
jgi:hypothetical protein